MIDVPANTETLLNLIIIDSEEKQQNDKYDLWVQSVKWYFKVFESLGIIYLVTPSVILFSVNSKGIHQSKEKPII